MSAVSETIVREYFEMHEFLVRQHRKYIVQARGEDDDIDFFVLNPHPQAHESALPFVLASRLEHSPKIFRFVEPKVFQQAARAFGKDGAPLKILVVPALPQEDQAREQSIALLRSKGVDAVIPFRTMLTDLASETQANRNYQKSDLLQIIRILKNYDLLKDPQMELFKPKRKKKA